MDWEFLLRLEVAGDAFLPFFDMREARNIRAVSSELRNAVAGFQWNDPTTHIAGSLLRWRTCFPRALCANIQGDIALSGRSKLYSRGIKSGRRDLSDEDFVHLAGIHTLNMSGCGGANNTDDAFVHLAGIHTLDMSGCYQTTITDAAFEHLAGIHTLNMSECDQATNTDAAIVY